MTTSPSEASFASYVQRVRMWLAGVTHHGKRDYYEVLGYNRFPRCLDFAARYKRQDIAKRIVNAPVFAQWADPPEILCDDQTFLDAWKQHCRDVKVWQAIIRLDKLVGLGQYAGLVIGFDDGQKLIQPVTKKAGRKVIYLQPYAEVAIKPISYETNQQSPRFGQPTVYRVTPGRFRPEQRTGGIGFTYTSEGFRPEFDVHYSRILVAAEDLLEDNVYGSSRLEHVANLLDDSLKLAGGGAETWWQSANRGVQVDVDKDMDLDPESADNLGKEIEEWQHELRRFVRTRGVTLKPLEGTKSDPTGPFNVISSLISAGTGIPRTVLYGSAIGVLASQQDRASWAERIDERAADYAEPCILRPYIDMMCAAGVLPVPANGYDVKWPDAFKLSPLEQGQTSAQMARAAANLSKADTNVPEGQTPLFTREEKRKIVSFGPRMPTFQETTSGKTLSDANPSGSPAQPGSGADATMGTGVQET